MKNRIYIFIILFCANIPFSRVAHSSNDTDVKFEYFNLLPKCLQLEILSHASKPAVGLVLSKELNQATKEKYVWAKSNLVLEQFAIQAYDDTGSIDSDSMLVRALNNSTRQLMLRRLILGMSAFDDEGVRAKVRMILVRQICDNIFSYKDEIINMSRVRPQQSGDILRLARGDMAHGCPLVHEEQVPQGYKGYLKSAELEIAQSTKDSVYRVWRLKSHPQQPTFSTVSLRHGEEFAILQPVILNGHIQTEGTKVMYLNNTPRDWPLKN